MLVVFNGIGNGVAVFYFPLRGSVGANLASCISPRLFARAIDHTIFYPSFVLLLFQISDLYSDYIKVCYFIPIDMAHCQAKPISKKSQRQASEPQVQGEVFGFHILAV